MKKLRFYGIDGTALNWIKSYLLNRQQCVTQRGFGTSSSFLNITDGVPQDSILGPFLFLVYINDLPSITGDSRLIMYADDTSALISDSDETRLSTKFKDDFSRMSKWFQTNGLTLNETKCNFINFHSNYSNITRSVPVTDNEITITSVTRFLGVFIDKTLSWKNHVHSLIITLNRAFFLILTLSRSLDRRTLITVYYAYVYSNLTYGVIFWGNSLDSHKVFKAQKKIIRIIFGLRQSDSCKPVFQEHNILTLPSIYIYQILTFVKSNIGKFTFCTENHNYNTRNQNILSFPIHGHSSYEKSPFYSGIRIYNALPMALKNIGTINLFKRKVRELLIEKNCYTRLFLINNKIKV